MLNVAFNLDATAARSPDAAAVVYYGRRYSYAEIWRLANQVANGLSAAGYGRGDCIAIACCNRPGFLAAYFGVLKCGAVAVVLSDTIKAHDLAYELADSEAKALFAYDRRSDTDIGEMAAEVAAETAGCRDFWVIPPNPEAESTIAGCSALSDLMSGQPTDFATRGFDAAETAIILYTSGSTGRPKGVEISQGNLTGMVMLNLTLAERDATRVRLVLAPMYDVVGQIYSLNLPVLSGETLVLVEAFDPLEIWRLIEREGVNYMAEMPIFYRRLLDHAQEVDHTRVRQSLKLCPTGGAPLPENWSCEFEERFGVPLRPGYGMTEATSTIAWNSPFVPLKTDSVGKVIPGVALRIVDEDGADVPVGSDGEIIVRSPGVMQGYLNQPEVTAKALRGGWLYTNDIGALDDDGYLYVRGRADGLIIRGPEHIYPAEIVQALERHPKVAQAAVKAVPHETLGQDAKAYVVLRDNCDIADRELLNWLIEEMPMERAPGHLRAMATLPLTRNGKIAYHQLP